MGFKQAARTSLWIGGMAFVFVLIWNAFTGPAPPSRHLLTQHEYIGLRVEDNAARKIGRVTAVITKDGAVASIHITSYGPKSGGTTHIGVDLFVVHGTRRNRRIMLMISREQYRRLPLVQIPDFRK